MEDSLYGIGDWVVHKRYGVGQIKGVEKRPINGEQTNCFKVKTKDSMYWFPATGKENPRIRSVETEQIIDKVIKTLRRKASNLDTDRKYWKSQISDAQSSDDLIVASKLIRDLSAQQVIRKLNQTEEKALNHFKETLIREWAAIMSVSIEKIRPRMNTCIQESKEKIKIEE